MILTYVPRNPPKYKMMYARQGPFDPSHPDWNPPIGKKAHDFQGPPITISDMIAKINQSEGGAGVSLEADPNGTPANAPGAKLDAGKLQAWLFFAGFAHALEDVANVTTVGALKYTENGWVDVPDGKKRYMNAFMRHALEFGKGRVLDDGPNGTGCTHISQMIWNLLAVHELSLRDKNGKTDGTL